MSSPVGRVSLREDQSSRISARPTTVLYTMVNGRLYDSLNLEEIGNYDRPRGEFYWEGAREP